MMRRLCWGFCALLVSSFVAQARTSTTIVSQVHNALGWLPNHVYTYSSGPPTAPFTRVNNGPGWNPAAQSFIPYRPLTAYQLTSTGTCTSASSGGPTGIGTAIRDGTCTWRYLSPTDYTTITGWANDNNRWKAQAYNYNDVIVSGTPLAAYKQTLATGCTSTIAPTGTGGTLTDGCAWSFIANITYTSGVNHIPTKTFASGITNAATVNMLQPYQAMLWNDREYVDGQNGEAATILLNNHNDRQNDSISLYLPPGSPGYLGTGICGNCMAGFGWPITITTAPGESFADTLSANSSLPLGDPSPALGVMIHGGSVPAITTYDNAIHFERLQADSDSNLALSNGYARACNYCVAEHSVLRSGVGAKSVNSWGISTLFDSDLVIARGVNGLSFDYPGAALHTTIVNEGSTPNAVAIEVGWNWVFAGQVVSNVAMYGFPHAAAVPDYVNCSGGSTSGQCINWMGANNYTDTPSGDNGTDIGPWVGGGHTLNVATLPGTTYGGSATASVVSWPGDYRPTGPLVGTGAAYGSFNICPIAGPPAPCPMTADTPDIIGTARPQAGRYDIGAWQSCVSSPSTRRVRCSSAHQPSRPGG